MYTCIYISFLSRDRSSLGNSKKNTKFIISTATEMSKSTEATTDARGNFGVQNGRRRQRMTLRMQGRSCGIRQRTGMVSSISRKGTLVVRRQEKKNERFKGLRGVKMQKAIATKKAQQAKTTVGKRDLKDSARKGVS
jgi:hypothetical protein